MGRNGISFAGIGVQNMTTAQTTSTPGAASPRMMAGCSQDQNLPPGSTGVDRPGHAAYACRAGKPSFVLLR